MNRALLSALTLVVCSAAFVVPALAADCEIDMTSPATILKTSKKCGFSISNQGVGKKTEAPKKIAIAAFQIRFDFTSQEYGSVTSNAYTTTKVSYRSQVHFENAVYQDTADGMYDMFVATMEQAGYEVLPPEAVKGAKAYALVDADDSAKEKKSMIRVSAKGLKNISGKGGAIGSIAAGTKLAGLNKELGTDAVFTVFSTMGLVKMKGKRFFGLMGEKKGATANVRVCLGTQDPDAGFSGGAPFQMLVLAGTKEGRYPGGKPMYSAEAQAQVVYNNKAMICGSGEIQERANSRWAWVPKYETQLDGYIAASIATFGWAAEIGVLQFDSVMKK